MDAQPQTQPQPQTVQAPQPVRTAPESLGSKELVERLTRYLVDRMLPQMSSWKTQAAIGVVASATGKAVLARRVEPFLALLKGDDGKVSLAALKDAALSAVRTAGRIPVLFDLVVIGERDVLDLFEFLAQTRPDASVPAVSQR